MKFGRSFAWMLLFVVAAASLPEDGRAEVATEASIRDLLAISGHEESLRMSILAIRPALQQMSKNISEQKLRELVDSENIVRSLVISYQRYFTEEEIQDMLSFYKTPTGGKLGKLGTRIYGEAADLHIQRWRASLIDEQIQKGNFKMLPR